MRYCLMFGLVAVLTTACSTVSLGPAPSQSSSAATAPRPLQRCDSSAAQWAVGKTNTQKNIEDARQRSGSRMARVLRPGQPTTRDINPERLNLELDSTGRITAARCG